MSTAHGKVYLVGAGPGDPELLTIKAARILREADVVLHDDLVSKEILALLPKQTTIISVGKRCGAAKITQAEINAMMISYARGGRTVIRLKSGDPMIFGRAGEEIEALREAGVDLEVVPGISAAFAAAAAAQVSLTDRRSSSRVIFESGHLAQNGTAPATRAIYMPGPNWEALMHRLIAEGVSSDIPCIVVSAVSSEAEILHRCLLRELQHRAISSPSVLIIGEVCGSAGADTMVGENHSVPSLLRGQRVDPASSVHSRESRDSSSAAADSE